MLLYTIGSLSDVARMFRRVPGACLRCFPVSPSDDEVSEYETYNKLYAP